MVVWLFLTVPWVRLQFVIVVFPEYTNYFLRPFFEEKKNRWDRQVFVFDFYFPLDELGHFYSISTKPDEAPFCSINIQKVFFLFLNQNICCGYSKEPSQWGSFEHPKHMLKNFKKEG